MTTQATPLPPDENQLITERREKLAALRKSTAVAFPNDFKPTHHAADLLFEETDALMTELTCIKRRVLGDVHPEVAQSLVARAGFLGGRGRWAEAVPLLEEAIVIRSELMGDDHPLTREAVAQLERTFAAGK